MKLLIDGTNIIFSAFFIQRKNDVLNDEELTDSAKKNLIIETFLSRILFFKKRFNITSSDLIIAFDHKISWRKVVFKHYKHKRKTLRDKSDIDFQLLWDLIDEFYEHLKMFPFITLRNSHLEADDWIAILSKDFSEHKTEHIIIAVDSDYYQLHNSYCRQFHPLKGEFINIQDSDFQLKLKIINGDRGDGIPNVFSESDAFAILGKRQVNCGEKKAIKIIKENPDIGHYFKINNLFENYKRNQLLIDFNKIPPKLREKSLAKYNEYKRVENKYPVIIFLQKKNLSLIENRVYEIFS